ncbi:hypothetical protein ACSSS7_007260 [Eimeria intestinalis]
MLVLLLLLLLLLPLLLLQLQLQLLQSSPRDSDPRREPSNAPQEKQKQLCSVSATSASDEDLGAPLGGPSLGGAPRRALKATAATAAAEAETAAAAAAAAHKKD